MFVLAIGSAIILTMGRKSIFLWAGPSAVPSIALLRAMCVWMIIFAFTLNQSCLMGATYRVGKQAVLSMIAALFNLALSIAWARPYGTLGVLMAAIVSYILFIVVAQNSEVRRILRGDFLPSEHKSTSLETI